VQELEHVVSRRRAAAGREGCNGRIGAGERALAQIEARREALDGTAHDALSVARLDLPFGDHGELAEGTLGGEGMGDVAEGVLVLVEPAIGRDVDPPARHVLAVVVARGQPQPLDDAGRGRGVAVARQVRDADAHDRDQVSDIRDQSTAPNGQNLVDEVQVSISAL
jgi:hypothetical protein